MATKITVKATGHFCNHWPYLKIILNDKTVYDAEVVDYQTIDFTGDCTDNNLLKFIHYGKRFNENNVWDTSDSADCFIVLDDILFDQVSIGNFKSQLLFNTHWTDLQLKDNDQEFISKYSSMYSNGMMSFNGEINFEFSMPVLSWLTVKKYKMPLNSTAYFSNWSSRWHYERDIEIINSIKKIMRFNENSSG